MTPEARKQLEEMACEAQLAYAHLIEGEGRRNGAKVRAYGTGYREGLQAAWEMRELECLRRIEKVVIEMREWQAKTVKAERERCVKLAEHAVAEEKRNGFPSTPITSALAELPKAILNLPAESEIDE